ncbi:hypothetical protein QJQ45_012324 [Haematococcus lacustris]|nr:hypothetical protein QJQ45_012324 [Haematococcus lacustris]
MTDIEHTPDLLRVARTPAIAAKHWKDDSAWQIAEALYSVMRKHDLEVLQSATFLSLSLDEATTVDNRDSQGYLCIDSAAGAGVAAGEQGAQEQGLEGGEVEGGKEGLDTLHQLSAVAPTQGRRGRAGPVPESDMLHHIAAAKQKLTAAAQAVVQDLLHRFVADRHAKALAVMYPNYWDTKPSDEDFLERLEAIKQL